MPYQTETEIIKHVFNELLPIIIKKYKLTREEKLLVKQVKDLLLKKIRRSNKKNG